MKVRVWDLPLRLCHWLLAASVATAFVSVQIGGNAMVWHGRAGLAVVGLLAAQAVSGLFANDDISYQGHLYALVGADLSARITGIHKLFEPIMIALVILHLGAIAFYVKVKKDNLTLPMITGWKDVAEPVETPRSGSVVAFLGAVVIAAGAAYLASGALLPPPPPAAVETPAF